jgi:CubicO group peptidase (beta-lactamase class C family)
MRNHSFAVFVLAGALSSIGAPAADDTRVKQVELGLLPVAATRLGVPGSIEDRMRAYGVAGLSVAVIDRGRIAWSKGYGIADSASGQYVTTRTLFSAASISKPISAMGALALVQHGRLRLDANVNAALTSWKIPDNDFTGRQPVTVRMLLNHTAGLQHAAEDAFVSPSRGDEVPSLVQVLSGEPPASTGPVQVVSVPGATFAYSGAGYEVLQQLVLDLSRESFEQYMQSAVLKPIGMRDSTFLQTLPAATLAHIATGHYAGGQPLRRRLQVGPELAVAGLWTTPTDIAKYIINVQQADAGLIDKPLGRDLVRKMLKPGLGRRGLGPAISGSGESVRFGHDGFNEGFESSFVAYEHGGQAAVVMANSGFAFMLIKEVLGSISRVYRWPDYGATTQQPPSAAIEQQRVVRVGADILDAGTGQYALGNITITLLRRGDRLFLDWPTNGVTEVFAVPDGRFFCPPLIFSDVGSPWLQFVRGFHGVVTTIRAGDDGRLEFHRL